MLQQYINNEYIRFLIILGATFLIGKFFTFFTERVLVSLTKKTQSKLDEIIIEKTKSPMLFLIFLIGLNIAINEFSSSIFNAEIVDKIFISLEMVTAFFIFYFLFELFIVTSLNRYKIKHKEKVNEAMHHLLEGTLKVVLIIAAFLSLLSYWGIEIGPLLTGLGIGGIALAFALQSTLGNLLGGLSIILDKSVKVGDLVNLDNGQVSGKILKINLRSTKIKTFDNELIIVPNSKLAENNIQNLAQPEPKSRVVVPFSVAYGSDIEKVKKIVLKEINSIKNFVNEPEPSVRFLEMADSSLNFKAYFFVNSFEDKFEALDEANTKIYNALNKNKISIPFPQMDVHIKKK